MSYLETLQQHNTALQGLIDKANGLPDAGGAEIVLQEKTVTPTKSAQSITADDGYGALSKVNVEAIPDEYIIPTGTLSVTQNGTHNAESYKSVEVNVPIPDGYIVPEGTLPITQNGTYNVTEYASINVNVPSKEPVLQEKTVTENGEVTPDTGYDGLSKVTVNVPSSGGDTSDVELLLLTRTMTEYSNSTLTTLGAYAFSGVPIVSLDLPALTTIGQYTFYECTTLKNMVFPSLTDVPYNGLRQFTGIVKADFHNITAIRQNGFYKCTNLETLIIRTNSVCTLYGGTIFTGSKIQSGTGYIYVPSSLVESYKAATNWSTFADQFRAIEDYPDICGG